MVLTSTLRSAAATRIKSSNAPIGSVGFNSLPSLFFLVKGRLAMRCENCKEETRDSVLCERCIDTIVSDSELARVVIRMLARRLAKGDRDDEDRKVRS